MRIRRLLPIITGLALLAPASGPTDGVLAAGTTTPTTTPTTTTTTTTVPAGTDPSDEADAPKRAIDLDPEHYVTEYPEQLDADVVAVAPGAPNVAPATPVVATTKQGTAQIEQPPPPGPGEDNVFVDSGDSVFVGTATDAESTFALDVDTGSYRAGQAQLDAGLHPDPASIRVEEWINAFRYGDPAPTTSDVGVTVQSGSAPHATDGTRLVRIGLSTRRLADEQRPPANVTFVIDTSGSMDIRDRLGLVKASLALLVQHLADGDTLSIVEYGTEARLLLEPTPVQQVDRIVSVIDELRATGVTNMEAGLRLGYAQARAALRPGGLNVVVLASDGVANLGATDAEVLTEEITRAEHDGIHLVTVGFGMGNFNDHLMEQLADRGDGMYAYVDTFAEARRLFVSDLTPTLTTAVRDAKVQVRFDPAVVESYRLIGYENRRLDDAQFDDPNVDAGELGYGHQVSALYEVRTRPGVTATTIGELAVRWRSVGGEPGELRQPLDAGAPDLPAPARLAATVAAVAEVLRHDRVVTERRVTLTELLADAEALRAGNVNGADELVGLIRQAMVAGDVPASSVPEG